MDRRILEFLDKNNITGLKKITLEKEGVSTKLYRVATVTGEYALKVQLKDNAGKAAESRFLQEWLDKGADCVEVIVSEMFRDSIYTLMPYLEGKRLSEILEDAPYLDTLNPYLDGMAKNQAKMHASKGTKYGFPDNGTYTIGNCETLRDAIEDKFMKTTINGLVELGKFEEFEGTLATSLEEILSINKSTPDHTLCHFDYSFHSIFIQKNRQAIIDPNPIIMPYYADLAITIFNFLFTEYLGLDVAERYQKLYNSYSSEAVNYEMIRPWLIIHSAYKMQKWYRKDQTKHDSVSGKRAEVVLEKLRY